MTRSSAPFLAVVGASGGLGGSTLALAVGRRMAAVDGSVAVVDLDLCGGGLEVSAGAEHLPGHRWADLAGVRGAVPGPGILAALPVDDGCRLLSVGSGTPRAPLPVPTQTVLDVLASLRGSGAAVVLDLPRGSPLLPEVARSGAAVVLLTALSTRGLADTDRVLDTWVAALDEGAPGPPVHLVTRGRRPHPTVVDDLVLHLGATHVHHADHDDRVARDAERGLWPGSGRDAVRRCADALRAVVTVDGSGSERAAS